MRGRLHIGEVAELLGITQKTIRHYHKVGLLEEPERSNGGYRLYGATDLLRLLHIRRLQALGLTLTQIKRVLGEPERERTLREVLTALAQELAAHIETLMARHERIQAFLAEGGSDVLEYPPTTPAIVREALERLDPAQISQISDVVVAQDVRMFGLLESFAWPASYQAAQAQMAREIRRLMDNPALYHEMVVLTNDLAALAQVPAASPEVERLIERFSSSPLAPIMRTLTPSAPSLQGDIMSDLLSEIMQSALSPAQARFIHLLGQRFEQLGGTEGG